MQIGYMKVEDYLNIKLVEINPDGGIVEVSGKNGAGKSSLIDAWFYAITGKGPEHPIREGETKATITVGLDEYTIVKTVKQGKRGLTPSLKITDGDGKDVRSPQKMLNELLGAITLDPIEFSRMDDKKRVEALLGILKLDFTAHDEARAELYDSRRDVGRDLKRAKGNLDTIGYKGRMDLEEPPDAGELADKLTAAQLVRDTYGNNVQSLNKIKSDIAVAEEHLEFLRDKRALLASGVEGVDAQGLDNNVTKCRHDIDEHATQQDTYNAMINHKEACAEVDDYQEDYDELSSAITAMDEAKIKQLAEAEMPVPGLELSVDVDGKLDLTYEGLPFDQRSKGETIRVSTALGIAANPKIKVLMIEDGSLLDDESQAAIRAMAEENDAQIWVEVVDDSGDRGIYIEAGEVKSNKSAAA